MIDIYWTERATRALPEGGDSDAITIDLLQLDIIEQDDYTVAAMVSAHAVETGTPTTDHIQPLQDRVTFTANVSGRQSSTRLVEGTHAGSFDAPGGKVSGAGIIVPENTDRIGDVHATLRRLCRSAIAIDVDGLRRPIEAWAIESVSSPRTVETSGLLVVDVVLVEVRYAELEETEAPSPRVERGRRARSTGRQQPNTADTDEPVSTDPEQRTSASVALLDAITGAGR